MESGARYQEELVLLLIRWDGMNTCNVMECGTRYQDELALLLICWDCMNACNKKWYKISGRSGIVVEMLGWYERMLWKVVRDIRKNWYCC